MANKKKIEKLMQEFKEKYPASSSESTTPDSRSPGVISPERTPLALPAPPGFQPAAPPAPTFNNPDIPDTTSGNIQPGYVPRMEYPVLWNYRDIKPVELTPLTEDIVQCPESECPCKWESTSDMEKRVHSLYAEDFTPAHHKAPDRDPGSPSELEKYVESTYGPDMIAYRISPETVVLRNGLFISLN